MKYKFLHMSQQEICGSPVRALPHGSEVAGSIPARSPRYEWMVCERRGGDGSGPPLSPRAMSSSGYAFQPEKKKISCLKFFIPRPFPTYLGYHHLLFKGVTPQRENDGNLHINL